MSSALPYIGAVVGAVIGGFWNYGAGSGVGAEAGFAWGAALEGAAVGMAAGSAGTPKAPSASAQLLGGPTPSLYDQTTSAAMDAAQQREQDRLARGRSSTILTGGQGSGIGDTVRQSSQLLGSAGSPRGYTSGSLMGS